MKKMLISFIIAAMVVALLPAAAMAATTYVNYDSAKSQEENGTELRSKIAGAGDGDVIVVGAGTYDIQGNRFDIGQKNLTIIGAGSDKTLILANKYGFVPANDNEDKDSRTTVTIKDMSISTGRVIDWGHPIYAKNNVTVYLENLVLSNPGPIAILLDSSNSIGGQYYNGIDTIVYAKNVKLADTGDSVEFMANPCNGNVATGEIVTYTHFYYDDTCTNMTKFNRQNGSLGFGNFFVNDRAIHTLSDPKDASVNPGEQATFTVQADDAKAYQWYVDCNDGNGWVEIPGATDASYTTDPAELTWNGFRYRCKVVQDKANTTDAGFYSKAAVLKVGEGGAPAGGSSVSAPRTGDNSQPVLWFALLCASAVLLGAMRRKNSAA